MKNDYFQVVRGGLNSTFQDLGRENLYHIGLPFSGAMDKRNFLIANKLIDNNKKDPVIEFAFQGPSLKYFGRKRNIACRIATGEFITFFDDDDIHYPTRVTAAVEALTKRGQRYICGSSKLDIADISTGKIYMSGTFAKYHANAGKV